MRRFKCTGKTRGWRPLQIKVHTWRCWCLPSWRHFPHARPPNLPPALTLLPCYHWFYSTQHAPAWTPRGGISLTSCRTILAEMSPWRTPSCWRGVCWTTSRTSAPNGTKKQGWVLLLPSSAFRVVRFTNKFCGVLGSVVVLLISAACWVLLLQMSACLGCLEDDNVIHCPEILTCHIIHF